MSFENEQSFSGDQKGEEKMGHLASQPRDDTDTTRWRFRPKLPPSGVVATLKKRIIPKIALVFRPTNPPQPAPAARFQEKDIEQFVDQLVQDHESKAFAYIERLLGEDMSAERIYSELLTPTAHRLSEMWESNSTDFSHIALGLGRIQEIVVKLRIQSHADPIGPG